MRRSLALSLALFAIAIPVALAACGGDDDETTTAASESETTSTEEETGEEETGEEETGEEATGSASASGAGGTVKISETEFKLTPSDPTTKAGTVTFDISNDGSTVHNLEVEGSGIEEESDDFQAGQSGKLTVDLKPGTYEIYCAIDDHKGLGMEGELTVQ